MGRHIRTGQVIRAELNLHDRSTDKFPQVRVTNEAGTEIAGSPFDLAHIAGGTYKVNINPQANGEYHLSYTVYQEVGHITILPVYGYPCEYVEVDNRIAEVSALETKAQADARQAALIAEHNASQVTLGEIVIDTGTTIPAQINAIETKAQADARQSLLIAGINTIISNLNVVDGNVDSILVDTDVTIPGLINALNDLAIIDIQTALTNQGYTSARATLISNLDVLLSTRSTQASVDLIDSIVDAILVDTDVTLPALINALETKAQADVRQAAIISGQGSLSSEIGVVDANVDSILEDTGVTIPALIAALQDISIADVQAAMTNQGYTAARAILISNLDVVLSTRSTQASVDVIDSIVDAILVDTDTTIPALIALLESKAQADTRQSALILEHNETQTNIAALENLSSADIQGAMTAQGYTAARSAKIDNLDTTISSRATQTSVDNLQNNSTFQVTLPDGIQRPETGSQVVKILTRLFNSAGDPADPSPSNVMEITIKEQNGTVKVATTAMTRTGIGAFEYDLTLLSTDNIGQYITSFDYEVSGTAIEQVKTFQYVESAATIDQVQTSVDDIITTIGTPTLATIAADINSRHSASQETTNQAALIAKHNTTQAELATHETKAEADIRQAALISEHDDTQVAIGNQETKAQADARQSILVAEHDDTQSKVDLLETKSQADARQVILVSEHDASQATLATQETKSEADSRQAILVGKVDDAQTSLDAQETKAEADIRQTALINEHDASQATLATQETKAQADARQAILDGKLDANKAVIDTQETKVQADSRQAILVSEHNTSQSKLDLQETKLQADARQSALVAEHDDTQSKIDNLENASLDDIANAVWEEEVAFGHTNPDSAGDALNKARDGADPEIVANNVWIRSSATYADPNTMGGKLNEARNQTYVNTQEINKVNLNLTPARAANLDFLDSTISSRQSTADANIKHGEIIADIANVQTVVDGISLVVGQPDPDNQSILDLLINPTYGLANLRIAIDSRASLSKQVDMEQVLNNTFGILTDGAIGLAILRAQLDAVITELIDTDHGLPRLRIELDNKPNDNELSYPTAIEVRDAVWEKLTSDLLPVGSFGKLVTDFLNVSVSSRSSQVSVDAMDLIIDQIKALLEDGTVGLANLYAEINGNEAKIDTVLTNLGLHDDHLTQVRADILLAINAIVSGTPTIIAALDEIKGVGYNASTDSLEKIRDAIGTGSATAGAQATIESKIDALQIQNNTVETKVDTANTEIQGNRTQILAKVDGVETKVDTLDTKSDSTLSQLTDANFGLSKAKADRDSQSASTISAIGTVDSKADVIDGKIDALDAKNDSNTNDILTAVGNIDLTTTESQLAGIIALLQDGSIGLSPIKQAIVNLASQEDSHFTASQASLSALDVKVVSLTGLVTAMQGAGFSASESLVAIKAAIETVGTGFDDVAKDAEITEILTQLENIKDGGTATFDGSTDSLVKIADTNNSISGVCGGQLNDYFSC